MLNPQCRECNEEDEEGECALDINDACSNCDWPIVYKCDRSDQLNPVCRECSEEEIGCHSEREVACGNCDPLDEEEEILVVPEYKCDRSDLLNPVCREC